MKVRIDDIKIGERQRKSITSKDYLEHVENLSRSISEFGLLQPIVLDRDMNLIAGYSRVQAHILLGKEEIEAVFVDEINELRKKEMELEENIRRKDLEWWEKVEAISEIHRLKSAQDPTWTNTKTANLLSYSPATITLALDLVKHMGEDPELKKEDSMHRALKKVNRKKRVEKQKLVMDAVSSSISEKGLSAVVKVGNAADLIKSEPSEYYDAIITNPPWGINLQYGTYEDDPIQVTDMLIEMCSEFYRVLKPNSWLVVFFDSRKITYNDFQEEFWKDYKDRISYLLEPADREATLKNLKRSMGFAFWLKEAGFEYVNRVPAIWYKPNRYKFGFNYDKNFINSYEPFILASKGDAVLKMHARQDVISYNLPRPSHKIHDIQMPSALCSFLVRLTCNGGGRVLDPFAGSGSVGIGALANECSFVGFELNEQYADYANSRLQAYIATGQDEEMEDEDDDLYYV